MTTRTERRLAKKQAESFPPRLQPLPACKWPESPELYNPSRILVWYSRDYFVQAFSEPGDVIRLSINSTVPQAASWTDGLSWDDLMEIKRQCGFPHRVAIEIYPDDENIVNVSNMRHLWLLPEPPEFMWRKS